ncbi:protein serine/threonine kinase, putative [Entamoeba invadens IP1]|uniref:Protein serine/threonine kinase, putative n=1 Tax=Entamoeba invadens IP1 TaxID=370355 RepID=A0A0A1TWZ9_ENTIV|nr:protein serine/threonine kinase, putative [Entamoeba invadens IP1]ELP85783.1 protein serine/threonine kinase, putative [Entamoeba invadens IP1]|eukprot:XP_004185129.1 protein serine/threonine kinase, putative [Entamoeba invadens IP1]
MNFKKFLNNLCYMRFLYYTVVVLVILFTCVQSDCWYSKSNSIIHDSFMDADTCQNRGYGWKLYWDGLCDWVLFTGECCENLHTYYVLENLTFDHNPKGIEYDESSNIQTLRLRPPFKDQQWSVNTKNIVSGSLVVLEKNRESVDREKHTVFSIGLKNFGVVVLNNELIELKFTEYQRPFVLVEGNNSPIRITEEHKETAECRYVFSGNGVYVDNQDDGFVKNICEIDGQKRYVKCLYSYALIPDCSCYINSSSSHVSFQDYFMNYPDCLVNNTKFSLTIRAFQTEFVFDSFGKYYWKSLLFEDRNAPLAIYTDKVLTFENDVVLPYSEVFFFGEVDFKQSLTFPENHKTLYKFEKLTATNIQVRGLQGSLLVFLSEDVTTRNSFIVLLCDNKKNSRYGAIEVGSPNIGCICNFKNNVFDQIDCETSSLEESNRLELVIASHEVYNKTQKRFWDVVETTDAVISTEIIIKRCVFSGNVVMVDNDVICDSLNAQGSIEISDCTFTSQIVIANGLTITGNAIFDSVDVTDSLSLKYSQTTINELTMEENSVLYVEGSVVIVTLHNNGNSEIVVSKDIEIVYLQASFLVSLTAENMHVYSGKILFDKLSVKSQVVIQNQIESISIRQITVIDALYYFDIRQSIMTLTVTRIPEIIQSGNEQEGITLLSTKNRQTVFEDSSQVKYMCDNQIVVIGNVNQSICNDLFLANKVCVYKEGIYMDAYYQIDYSCPCKSDPTIERTLIIEDPTYTFSSKESYNSIITKQSVILSMKSQEVSILLYGDIQLVGNNNTVLVNTTNPHIDITVKGDALIFTTKSRGFDVEGNTIKLTTTGVCSYVLVTNSVAQCLSCRFGSILHLNDKTNLMCLPESVTECTSYNSKGNCEECSRGFYLKNGVCLRCPDRCQKCEYNTIINDTSCILCDSSYYLFNETCIKDDLCTFSIDKTCYYCGGSKFYSTETNTCEPCLPNCIQCDNNITCNICDISNGFFGTQCEKRNDIIILTNSNYMCFPGYYRTESGCSECRESCDECVSGDNETEYVCVSCNTSLGYTLDQTGLCSNTSSCYIENSKCQKCKNESEYYDGFQCTSCGEHCSLCTPTGQCLACDHNYYFHRTTNTQNKPISMCTETPVANCEYYEDGRCVSCDNTTYYTDFECVKCLYPCLRCVTSSSLCVQCSEGFMLQNNKCISSKTEINSCKYFTTTERGGCVVCKDYYYLDYITCYPCQQNCRVCQNSKSCVECGINYFINESGLCESIFSLTNCVSYSLYGCKECDTSAYLDFGRCVDCDNFMKHCTKCHWEDNECFGCDDGYILINSTCYIYNVIAHCVNSIDSKCSECTFWYEPSLDGLTCEMKSLRPFVITCVVLFTVFVTVPCVLISTVLITKKVHQVDTGEREMLLSRTRIDRIGGDWIFLNIKGLMVTKSEIVFNEMPVATPSYDSFYIGNSSRDTSLIGIGLFGNKKYETLIKPDYFELKKNGCCEVKIMLKPLCTTNIHEKIQIVQYQKNQLIKGFDSIDLIATTQLSTHLDSDELIRESLVGEGTFGIVYKGKYRGAVVAIKTLKKIKILENVLDDFLTEIEMLEKIRCEYIVSYFGSAWNKAECCLVTEFAELGSLSTLMENKQKVSLKIREKIMLDAARGIEYLHNNGILHRDIKPDNLLIFSIDSSIAVNAKLTDFGSSRSVKLILTNVSFTRAIGTPVYMAPEILQKKKYKMPADIFSFSIMFFETMTWGLAYPYEMKSWEIANAVVEGKRPVKSEGMSKKMYDFICSMWCQKAKERLGLLFNTQYSIRFRIIVYILLMNYIFCNYTL